MPVEECGGHEFVRGGEGRVRGLDRERALEVLVAEAVERCDVDLEGVGPFGQAG